MTSNSHEDRPPEFERRYTLGTELRLAREERGLTIRDVVDAVRIQTRYLEALEDGRIGDLPGTVYALGFVRTYADYLGLDGADMVARFKEEAEGLRAQEYVLPEPIDEGKVPTTAIIVIAVLLAGVAYGAWHFLYRSETLIAEQVPDIPERLAALVPSEETAPAGDGQDSGPAEPPAVVGDSEPRPLIAQGQPAGEQPPAAMEPMADTLPSAADAAASQPEVVPAVPAPQPAPETPAAEDAAERTDVAPAPEPEPVPEPATDSATGPASEGLAGDAAAPRGPVSDAPATVATADPVLEVPSAPESTGTEATPGVGGASDTQAPPSPPEEVASRDPRVYGADNLDARIVINAEEDAWIEVTDPDGDLLFSRVLRRGDSYHVPERPGAVFVTGNAGGLEIVVDGEVAPALGPAGVVRRNVRLDPEQLKSGTAWP